MKKILLAVLTMICIGAVLGTWQIVHRRHVKKNGFPIKTEKPVRKDLVQYVTATGNLKAKDQISVGSLVAGRVEKFLVEDNDHVKSNQLLAVLDNGIGDTSIKNVKAQLKDAQAKLTFTQAFFKRQKALYEAGQLSKNLFEQYTQDLTVAQAKVEQLQASLEQETKTYENLFIRSPANGIVIARKVNLGQMITSALDATVLFEIAKDLENMEAWIDVDESDVGMVKEGQEANFTVDSFPKLQFNAKVNRVQYLAKIIDNVVTYAAVLDVSNPDLKLRPGMTTNVEIKTAYAPNAIAIPNKALRINVASLEAAAQKHHITVIPLQGLKVSGKGNKARDFIWILENKKTARQIEVDLGVSDGRYTQIPDKIDTQTDIIVDVEEAHTNHSMLEAIFSPPGSIGK